MDEPMSACWTLHRRNPCNLETGDCRVCLAWLAGILEGEGSFMAMRNIVNKKVYTYPAIVVSMTDQDTIATAAHLLGRKPYGPFSNERPRDTAPRKLMYRAILSGYAAASMMRRLLPFMGERRSSRIREILMAWDDRPSTRSMRSASCSRAAAHRPRSPKGQFLTAPADP